MTGRTLRPLLVSLGAALALVVAACGGSDKNGSSSSSSYTGGGASQETGPGKTGGVLRQLGTSDVDYLDPGHTYFTVGYQYVYAT
jgi:peptide/nickel transport system substrate-binding protein